ncbi:serine/threonine-protein kinase [Actinomadura geliboluensis]
MQPLEPDDPRQIGAYRLTARIGEGGQGVVYLGTGDDGVQVAVKLFHAQLSSDLGTLSALDMFTRELEAAKHVARFCTAQVLDSGAAGNRRYIVSEYVDGPPLSRVVAEQGPRSGSALDRLAIATATALVALHDAGIVHRDFKPHNVLIGADGARVIDFGISRALSGAQTMVSRAVGTPAYMAPEQLEPGELTPAADVFAWASTMAFAATGRPPFGNESVPVVFNRIANSEPDLTGVEEPLRGLLTECFAKDPERRPSAQAVLDRLVRPGRAPSPPPPGTLRPPVPAAALLPPTPLAAPPEASENAAHTPPPPPAVPLPPAAPPPVAGRVDAVTAPHGGGGRAKAALIGGGAAVAAVVAVVFGAVWFSGDEPVKRDEGVAVNGSAGPGSPQPGIPAEAGSGAGTRSPSPSTSPSAGPSRPGASGAPSRSAGPSKAPSTAPTRAPKLARVELGPGHFTEYCVKLGWEWVEYRETPSPGAYCIKRKGDTMKLSAAQLDGGCQWRYGDGRARHYFKGKSNYCYAMKPAS